MKSLSCVRLLATPWTAAYQAPPSMEFSRQEYWSGVPLHFLPLKAIIYQMFYMKASEKIVFKRCQPGYIPSGGSTGESISLPFLAQWNGFFTSDLQNSKRLFTSLSSLPHPPSPKHIIPTSVPHLLSLVRILVTTFSPPFRTQKVPKKALLNERQIYICLTFLSRNVPKKLNVHQSA